MLCALALTAVVARAALLVSIAGSLDVSGTASWSNLTLRGATLIMAALGFEAPWRAWRGPPAAPRAVRALAWASGIVVTGLALFLAGYGWIGVKLWAAG